MAAAAKDDEKSEVDLTSVSDAERAEYADAFKLFDKDDDGNISVNEIYEVFQSLGIKQYTKKQVGEMLKAFDADDNGELSLDEFIVLLRKKGGSKKGKLSYDEELKQAFAVFDVDGNGTISDEELASVMNALGENLTKADIDFMIKAVDINSDGEIDFDEFKKMMQLAPIPQDTVTKLG